jgi:hypothetical protein
VSAYPVVADPPADAVHARDRRLHILRRRRLAAGQQRRARWAAGTRGAASEAAWLADLDKHGDWQ